MWIDDERLAQINVEAYEMWEDYASAVRRLLRAGDAYVQRTGHRAPRWLGTIHHMAIRSLTYHAGFCGGRCDLADELLEDRR